MPKHITEEQVVQKDKNTAGKVFIRVTLPGEEGGFIDHPDHAKMLIDEMVFNAEEYGHLDGYEFRPVIMTETEFAELPEFDGF